MNNRSRTRFILVIALALMLVYYLFHSKLAPSSLSHSIRVQQLTEHRRTTIISRTRAKTNARGVTAPYSFSSTYRAVSTSPSTSSAVPSTPSHPLLRTERTTQRSSELLPSTEDIVYRLRREDDAALSECVLKEYPDGWTDDIVSIVNPDRESQFPDCDNTRQVLTELNDGRVSLIEPNSNKTGALRCRARGIMQYPDMSYEFEEWQDISSRLFTQDVVHVKCSKDTFNTTFYQNIHTQLFKTRKPDNKKRKEVVKDHFRRPGVHIILLDSVGNTAGLRSLSRTTSFLREAFGAVNFRHLNKVGYNSRPNGAALLFGMQLERFDRRAVGKPSIEPEYNSSFFCHGLDLDSKKFVLREFEKQRGYVTLMSEDWSEGVFTYPQCSSFRNLPTTHFFTTMLPLEGGLSFPILFENDEERKNFGQDSFDLSCAESYQIVLSHLSKFFRNYHDVPKASLIWLVELAHRDTDVLFRADSSFHEFLQENLEELDNSFLFFMSDHGMRWGDILSTKIGELEANNPMLFVSVPRWLRSNKKLMANMRFNSNELLTQFDVHATLIDLTETLPKSNFTNFDALEGNAELRGSSLFRPLPEAPRNCFTLPIPIEYCICHRDTTEINDPYIDSLAGRVIEQRMADILTDANITHLCQPLRFSEMIYTAFVHETRGLFRITAQMTPGGGVFDALLRDVGPRGNPRLELAADFFSRLNEYGHDAECLDDSGMENLRPYCFCRQ